MEQRSLGSTGPRGLGLAARASRRVRPADRAERAAAAGERYPDVQMAHLPQT